MEQFDVLVIGGGQAGLAMGYHLQAAGISFVIVDSHPPASVIRGAGDGTRSSCSARAPSRSYLA